MPGCLHNMPHSAGVVHHMLAYPVALHGVCDAPGSSMCMWPVRVHMQSKGGWSIYHWQGSCVQGRPCRGVLAALLAGHLCSTQAGLAGAALLHDLHQHRLRLGSMRACIIPVGHARSDNAFATPAGGGRSTAARLSGSPECDREGRSSSEIAGALVWSCVAYNAQCRLSSRKSFDWSIQGLVLMLWP